MIVLEDKFELMFKDLPKMVAIDSNDDYPVVFGYGDKKELNAFLSP